MAVWFGNGKRSRAGAGPGEDIYLPEIQERRSRRRRSAIFLTFFFAAYLLALGSAWLVLNTDVFRLKTLEITGNAGVSERDILDLLRWQVLGGSFAKHLLGFDNILVWPGAVPPEALSYLPALKDLSIRRDYRARSVSVAVTERKPFGVWCSVAGGTPECFWFDDAGVVISVAPIVEGSLIPAVNDYSGGKLKPGSRVLSAAEMPNMLSVLQVLTAARIRVKEVRLEDPALSELKVLTYDGPALYFSLRFPADGALAVLDSLRAGGGTAALSNLEYVDFRVENRAYYK